jgi:type II restriction enzyme
VESLEGRDLPIDYSWDDAIRAFWAGRDLQTQRQIDAGRIDAGTRGAVTGGKHLEAMQEAVAELFRDAEGIEFDIRSTGRLTLPGYYRRTKDWDLIVLYRGVLVAAIEFKSQVGSFGNNFNNRTEEAIGNAADVWRAYQEGYLGQIKPWLAFVMILEKAPVSTAIRKTPPALFPTDPEFDKTSYLDRYRILMRRLVREQQYDAAVVAATEKSQGIYDEPDFELSFANLGAAIKARIEYIRAIPDSAYDSRSIVSRSESDPSE